MIRRLLIHDGVEAVCLFRDDGSLVEAYGLVDWEHMEQIAQFAYQYRRVTQANIDQFSLFAGMRGWTPPRGWLLRGGELSLCGMGNVVCLLRHNEININELLPELQEVAHW